MEKKGWGKFVVGAGIGVGLRILFAPKKGSETRQELKEKVDELMAKTKEIKIEDVTKMVEEKINELKKEIKDLDKEKVLKIAKEKGEKVKEKAGELVQLAKEKGTPMLHDAAMEVKAKAINVLEETIDRLEKDDKNDKKKKEK